MDTLQLRRDASVVPLPGARMRAACCHAIYWWSWRIPSAIYDMMKVAAGRKSIDIDWDELINDAFKVTQGRNIKPIRRANTSFLAESETNCISQTIAEFGRKTFGELTDITHDAASHGMKSPKTNSSRLMQSQKPCRTPTT